MGLWPSQIYAWPSRIYGGGPCDFSVSPSPFGLDFGTLDLGLTTIDKELKGFANKSFCMKYFNKGTKMWDNFILINLKLH